MILQNMIKIEKLLNSDLVNEKLNFSCSKLSDITTNLQGATKGQLVIYKIPDSKKGAEAFLKRLSNSNYGALLINKKVPGLESRKNILISEGVNFFNAQQLIVDESYPYKRDKIKIVGVTGTNGKTTVAYLLMQLGKLAGLHSLYVGTIGIYLDGKLVEKYEDNTTPPYVFIRKLLYDYQDTLDLLVLEVSSHALDQDRLRELRLDVAGFVSFSQDHLDYHKTMDNYLQAKLKIFSISSGGVVLPSPCNFIPSKFSGMNSKKLEDYPFVTIPDRFKIPFNKLNLEIALGMAERLGLRRKDLSLENLFLPKGRFHEIHYPGKTVVVDYAHTPDALEKLLSGAREVFKGREIWVLFGCGGDRDRKKRPLMAQAVERFADEIVITSDNPRTEDPINIINDIKAGITSKRFHEIADRREAIRYSLKHSKAGSVIIIAGKGHEEYQEIDGIKYPFSDFDVVKAFFEEE